MRHLRSTLVAILFVLAPPALISVAFLFPLLSASKGLEAEQEIILQRNEALVRQIESISTGRDLIALPEGNFWLSPNKGEAQLQMQELVILLARRAKISTTNFRSEEIEDLSGFERLSVRFEGTGSWNAILEFLHDLSESEPTIAVSSFRLTPASTRQIESSDQNLRFQAIFWTLWRSDDV